MNVVMIMGSYNTEAGLSPPGKARAKHAASVLSTHSDYVALVTGGDNPYSPSVPQHHQLVANELVAMGISQSRIIARLTDANTTVDEAADAAESLGEVDLEKLIVVTSLAHYPRAPFIFAHFFPIATLRFEFVPEVGAKDVLRFTNFKEAEAYQEQRRQGGVMQRDGRFTPTTFSYTEYASLLREQTEFADQMLEEHDLAAGTQDLDLFEMFEPHLPYDQGVT